MKRVLASILFLATILLLSHSATAQAGTSSLDDQLLDAALSGDTATVQQMLDKGANIEARDMFRFTALIKAAGAGKTDTVKLLLAKGANVEAKGFDDVTAMMMTAGAGNADVVKLLLDKGANIETRDAAGGRR